MEQKTKAIHSGQGVDEATSAIAMPIHLSTTFERAADGTYPNGHVYSRYTNPNRLALEKCLTDLEGGTRTACFSSGSAAMMTLLQTLLPGDHVIAPDIIYFGISELMKKIFTPLGIDFEFVNMSNLDAVKAAIKPNTKLVIAETPSNPQITITDIKAVAAIAHEAGALCVVDNTIATPILQSPLALGADMVIHATTKYIAGHSDVLGGSITTADLNDRWEKIVYLQQMGGAVPSPFECWLAMRGMQTMSYRVKAMSEAAKQIAKWLDEHTAVEKVLYPGLESSPDFELASAQMKAGGGLLSFLVKGGAEEAINVSNRLTLFTCATSFGGTHSLIEHRASVEAEGSITPKNLLRMSVGLEDVEDLIADLEKALTLV